MGPAFQGSVFFNLNCRRGGDEERRAKFMERKNRKARRGSCGKSTLLIKNSKTGGERKGCPDSLFNSPDHEDQEIGAMKQ